MEREVFSMDWGPTTKKFSMGYWCNYIGKNVLIDDINLFTELKTMYYECDNKPY
jgi:hypothetical protein